MTRTIQGVVNWTFFSNNYFFKKKISISGVIRPRLSGEHKVFARFTRYSPNSFL